MAREKLRLSKHREGREGGKEKRKIGKLSSGSAL
jgi:hypothetical protein